MVLKSEDGEELEVEQKAETYKAILFEEPDGKKFWIPKSQIQEQNEDEVMISNWIWDKL